MYRLTADFSEQFRSTYPGDAVRDFADACVRSYGSNAAVEVCEPGRCVLMIHSDSNDKLDWKKRVNKIFKQLFSRIPTADEVSVEVQDCVIDQLNDIWDLLLTPSGGSSRGISNEVLTPEEQIEALVGADQFKELTREICSIAPAVISHRTYNAFACRSYLFSINDGCGYTTYLKMFASLVEKLGLFHFSEIKPIVEHKMASPSDRDVDPVGEILSKLQKTRGSLFSIDIREWISKTDDPRFRNLLSGLEDSSSHNIFIFRVPFLESEVLDDLSSALKDILYVRPVAFPPMSTPQLCECADRILARYGFTVSDDGREILCARIQEEKSDGRFYGINTVQKIICEMIYRKHLHDTKAGSDDCVIRACDIAGLSYTYGNPSSVSEDDLADLVGLEPVKTAVAEVVAQIQFALRQNRDRPCIHMRFVGNPGTGKTTVARILGRILKEKGILRHGHFLEYSGRDFCGRYIGETAPKTTAICRDAYGSVLFIDEAYSLYRGDDNPRDFGREVLDTLIAEMENHRQDLLVIMAGYPDEMNTLLRANPGLESRMPYLVEFPNYTREELTEIFFRMIGDAFTYDPEFESAVRDYFSTLSDEVIGAKTFSNARFVRNLFERTCAKAFTRSQFDGDGQVILTKEDFCLAAADSSFRTLVEKKSRPKIGF